MTNKKNKDDLKIIYAGIDDGYRETKIYLSTGETVRIDSQAKSGEQTQISIGGGEKTAFQYDVGKSSFVIGSISESDPTAFDEYPYSDMNRAIVTHALVQLGLTDKHQLSITSGLPVKKFYRGKNINQEAIKRKTKNLLMNDVVSVEHTVRGKHFSTALIPNIVSHKVVSEGIAAWMDYVIIRNSDGVLERNEEAVKQRIAIIDIGGRTTDIAVIQGGNLDFQRSTTIEAGMLNIEDHVKEAISDEYDFSPNVEQMNQLMETGFLDAWGDKLDVTAFIKEAKSLEANTIRAEITSRLKKAADIHKVIFVGGTVMSIRGLLEGVFKNQMIAEDPGFANARGMAKFAELSHRNR